MEFDIDQLVLEYESKPAMVVSKVYLMSRTNPYQIHHIQRVLLQRLEVLSETANEQEKEFQCLHDFARVLNISAKNDELRILHAFYSLRVESNLSTKELQQILKATSASSKTKALIVRVFSLLLMGVKREAYKALLDAFHQDRILETRSIMCSFPERQVIMLKECLIKGRKTGQLPCTCNMKERGWENFGYDKSSIQTTDTHPPPTTKLYPDISTNLEIPLSGNFQLQNWHSNEEEPRARLHSKIASCSSNDLLANAVSNKNSISLRNGVSKEASFTSSYVSSLSVCDLHRIITELDEIIQKLRISFYDATSIFLTHKNAKRQDIADEFLQRHETRILVEMND